MNIARATKAVAVAATVALTGAACGVPTSDEPTLARANDVPFGLLATSTTLPPTTTAPNRPAGPELTVCMFREGQLVTVARPGSPQGLDPALTALRSGVSEAERITGLASALFDGAVVTSIAPRAGVALVDLGEPFAAVGPGDQLRIIAQLVCTFTAQPGTGQVLFTFGGNAVEVPRGDGSLTAAPVSRDDYSVMIATAG